MFVKQGIFLSFCSRIREDSSVRSFMRISPHLKYCDLFKNGNFPCFTVCWKTLIVWLEWKFSQTRNTSPNEILELCFV